jgi:hypothetical protein
MGLFEGGAVPLVSITPQFLGNLATQTLGSVANAQITTLTGQVFQGAGQSFLAQTGQAVVANSANNFINVGVNPLLSQDITQASGLSLSTGQNFSASSISQSITSALSSQLNANLSQTLQSAGPFGPLISTLGTSLVNSLGSSILGGFGGGAGDGGFNGAPGTGFSSKTFPGAGDEPEADYGGSSYTLNDIVFSIQPANQGPQSSGLQEAINDPKSITTLSSKQYAAAATLPNNTATAFKTEQLLKVESMGTFGQSAGYAAAAVRSSNTATAFNTGQLLTEPSGRTFNASGVGNNFSTNTGVDLSRFAGINLPPGVDKLFGVPASSNTSEGSPSQGGDQSWTFITAPKNISWNTQNQASRVSMFGTNNPPVVAGTRGMRDLDASECLVEGFIRNKVVEDKVRALEDLMSYKLNGSDGFVSVPVYQFWAQQKNYGGTKEKQTGYFIIKDVKVKEEMRDLQGKATRAMVDISFTEVPEYQVNSGRDIASQATGGAKSTLASQAQTSTTTAQAGVKGQANQGVAAAAGTKAGPGAGGATAAAQTAATGADTKIKALVPNANNFRNLGQLQTGVKP